MVLLLPMQGTQENWFDPWVGKIPWSRKWQPTPVFLPGKSHGQRSLVGCSPWGCEESDRTERLILSTFLFGGILLSFSGSQFSHLENRDSEMTSQGYHGD